MEKPIKSNKRFANRELSWLAFNHRVLQEAESEKVPLIERIRFLGIFSNNLDEFFRVRVANLQRATIIGHRETSAMGFDIKQTLTDVNSRVQELQTEYNEVFFKLGSALESEGIYVVNEGMLTDGQAAFASSYFAEKIRPSLVPIMVGQGVPFPELKDGTIYLAIALNVSENGKKKVRYAVIEVPVHLPRFVVLPPDAGGEYVMFIEDVIRLELGKVFALFKPESVEVHAIKVTRDAEIDVDDDLSRSLMEKMSRGVARRKKGDYVRFLYDVDMPNHLFAYLKRKLRLADTDSVISGVRYHNRKDLMAFPDFGRSELVYEKMPPLEHPALRKQSSLINAIVLRDVLIHYPYEGFNHVVDVLREAAVDPYVQSIRINLYRIANHSQIINALVNAAKNAKNVQVVVELAARFDEKLNMEVSNLLQEAGAQVEFGVRGLKVHSKLFLITRRRGKRLEKIAHIGTGNFHEKNANLYGDFGLLTADPVITKEVEQLFSFFSNHYERPVFKQLMVSPYTTRSRCEQLISREIANAKKGGEAWMIVKMNNLVDPGMILRLYAASRAGVRVELIVRGICTLLPGVKGMSENIRVRSIIGRYLEHSRILVFAGNGEPEYFLSSADWMSRNLDRRVEVTVPIKDARLKHQLQRFIDLQLQDNVKARKIDGNMLNKYVPFPNGAERVDSQEAMYRIYTDSLRDT